MFFVQINHTGKGFLFLIFREIKLRKYSSLHKKFDSLEIEELILSKNTLENNVIKLEKIEKICDELFENELAGNGKTWQREGIDILLTKLGIDRINNFC
ncbi:hypothetical protein ACTQ1F_05995 [Lactobacillus amylovorus]|uniref:hypothetical protein n=1 Tax=Lactobacillus amylovorus TaxID=1604 RepID=UPI003F8F560A